MRRLIAYWGETDPLHWLARPSTRTIGKVTLILSLPDGAPNRLSADDVSVAALYLALQQRRHRIG